MAQNIERIAQKLGAEIVAEVPDTGGGAFGAARLAAILRSRLEPAKGKRPGRPTNQAWTRRPKIPMSDETESRLGELAAMISNSKRKVSPMQVAAQLLEDAIASFYPKRPAGSGSR